MILAFLSTLHPLIIYGHVTSYFDILLKNIVFDLMIVNNAALFIFAMSLVPTFCIILSVYFFKKVQFIKCGQLKEIYFSKLVVAIYQPILVCEHSHCPLILIISIITFSHSLGYITLRFPDY